MSSRIARFPFMLLILASFATAASAREFPPGTYQSRLGGDEKSNQSQLEFAEVQQPFSMGKGIASLQRLGNEFPQCGKSKHFCERHERAGSFDRNGVVQDVLLDVIAPRLLGVIRVTSGTILPASLPPFSTALNNCVLLSQIQATAAQDNAPSANVDTTLVAQEPPPRVRRNPDDLVQPPQTTINPDGTSSRVKNAQFDPANKSENAPEQPPQRSTTESPPHRAELGNADGRREPQASSPPESGFPVLPAVALVVVVLVAIVVGIRRFLGPAK